MKLPKTVIGIVGCGYMGARHAQKYVSLGVKSFLLHDVDRNRAEMLAGVLQRLGAHARAVSWPTILNRCRSLVRDGRGVAAVDCCTPPAHRLYYVQQALQNDIPVLCEKPLATRPATEAVLLNTARQSKGWLAVAYPYRHHPAMRWVNETISDGRIGEPHIAYFRLGVHGGRHVWKHQSHTDGGVANEVLCHLLDLALFFFGPVQSGQLLDTRIIRPDRTIAGKREQVTMPDFALYSLQHECGVHSYLIADMFSTRFAQSVEIQGSRGGLWASICPGKPSFLRTILDSTNGQTIDESHVHPETDMLAEVLTKFLASTRDGRCNPDLVPIPGTTKWLSLAHSNPDEGGPADADDD